MNLEQQVCSLEPSQKLKELGVKQAARFYWNRWDDGSASLQEMKTEILGETHGKSVSAFTVAELGEMLRKCIAKAGKEYWLNEAWMSHGFTLGYVSRPSFDLLNEHQIVDANEADARAKMLIYLIDNKLIEAHGIISPKDGAKPRKVL